MSATADSPSGDGLCLQIKWQSQSQTLVVPRRLTVGELVEQVKACFGLSSAKLIGLVKGRLPDAATPLAALNLPATTVKISVIGVAAESIADMGEKEVRRKTTQTCTRVAFHC